MRVGLRPSLLTRRSFYRLPSHPRPGKIVLHSRGDLDHWARRERSSPGHQRRSVAPRGILGLRARVLTQRDRKSTRLNSSHANISYAVFCLKKKKKKKKKQKQKKKKKHKKKTKKNKKKK